MPGGDCVRRGRPAEKRRTAEDQQPHAPIVPARTRPDLSAQRERFRPRDRRTFNLPHTVSDRATVAYLADVYVLPAHRGRGLGLELVREIVEGGECAPGGSAAGVRWLLHTADAQALYAKLGFTDAPPVYPLMERGRSSVPRP